LDHGSIAKLHVKGEASALTNLRTGARTAPLYVRGGETVFEIGVSPQMLAMYRWE